MARGWRIAAGLPRNAVLAVFRTWQLLVSPLYGQTCRFYPSCSAYGVESVRVHGALPGLALTGWRILRCNPWNPGGVDAVPPRGEFRRPFRRNHPEHHQTPHAEHAATDGRPVAADACPDETAPGSRRVA